jgi:hypothetical protein
MLVKFEFLSRKQVKNHFMTFVVLKMKPLVQVLITAWLLVAVVYVTKVWRKLI